MSIEQVQAQLINVLNYPQAFLEDKVVAKRTISLVEDNELASIAKRKLLHLLLETICKEDDSIEMSDRRDVAMSLIEAFSFDNMTNDDISGPFLQTLYRVDQKYKQDGVFPHQESLLYLGGIKKKITEVLDSGRGALVEERWKIFIEKYPNVYEQQVLVEGHPIEAQADDQFPLIGKNLGVSNHRELRSLLLTSYERAHGVLKQMYIDLGLTSSYQQKQVNKLLDQYGIRSRRG